MTRIPIPDDYEREYIGVSGSDDSHYGQSDVNLDDVDHARDLTVQEDDDGRYVGVSEDHADAVAEFLGVSMDDDGSQGQGDEGEGDDQGDEDQGDVETCDAVKADGEVCGRELPCPYHDDEDRGEGE